MSMVLLDDLLTEVLPLAPNVPEPIAIKHLRDCAREFCERTKAWRDNDSFEVSAPDFEVLRSTDQTSIVAIEEARLNGHRLSPIAIVDLDREEPGWRTNIDEATARWVTQLQLDSLTVYPREPGTLTLGLVLKPSRTSIEVPDWLVEQYGTQIGRGAAGRVLVSPGVEYANPTIGSPLIIEFSDFLDTASTTVRKGQQGARKRTRPVYF
jgi:hypothetical protein